MRHKNFKFRILTSIASGRCLGLTLPVEYLRILGWEKGDKILVEKRGKKLILKKPRKFLDKLIKREKRQLKEEIEIPEKELKYIVNFKELEKWIIRNVGRRCKTYTAGCYCCDVWHGYDILKSLISEDHD